MIIILTTHDFWMCEDIQSRIVCNLSMSATVLRDNFYYLII